MGHVRTARWLGVGVLLGVAGTASFALVLTTITVDGNMSDWSAVLADPNQTAYDGPAQGLVDRDAPVQSTGRDLTTFAWTYDTSNLYLYVGRVASSSNLQRFWYYVDTSGDGLMQSGEPVLLVEWWGRNRKTDAYLYSYSAVSGTGDPLGDPAGYADGWTMPGTVSGRTFLYSGRGGSSNGIEMEAAVSWAALGVAPGAAMQFHVSSSNSTNIPSQIFDNMSGPGGSVGTTAPPGVDIAPAAVSGTIVAGGVSWLAHTVTNTGDASDTIDFSWSSSGAFTPTGVAFFLDVDGDGEVGPSDVLLTDTTGDGLPDHGPIAAGASFDIVVVPSAPATVSNGDVMTLQIVASSSADPAVRDTANDTVTVAAPVVTLVKAVSSATAVPGDTLDYTMTYSSTGADDARNVVLVDAIPSPTVYVVGSSGSTGPATTIEFSHDGGSTFDGSETPPITHIRWSLQAPLVPGATGSVSFRVAVP